MDGPLWLRWVALAVFIAAGVTDFLDGYYARIWDQHSAFGRMLDPIADKLLVASCLLMLARTASFTAGRCGPPSSSCAAKSSCRGCGNISRAAGQRARDQARQWKTTVQLVAIGFLLAGEAGDQVIPITTQTGLLLLWISAIFTIYTGWDYFRAGIHHLIKEDEE